MNIELIEPVDGSVTQPLQMHVLPQEPLDEDAAAVALLSGAAADGGLDRSAPRPVRLAWKAPARAACDVELWPGGDETRRRVIRGVKGGQVELCNLLLGTCYCWKVVARKGRGPVGESLVGRFTTHPAPPRWLAVPGITNVRDLGGWPLGDGVRIRQGMIYRGSEMDSHQAITPAGRCVLQEELGIRTDLDLRGVGETAAAVLDQSRVNWINVPVLPYEYIRQPIISAGYRRIFQVLADERCYPILVHCWGGADRTGTVAFLLGALLGQSEALLALEYELTSLSVWGRRSRHSQEFCALKKALRESAGVERADLGEQAQAYLMSIGISAKQIGTIRRLLIEQA
jgi:protein-tyrosine phosphatase